ncbi:MAG: hypothetical protein M4579_002713 [Chaenotheca gracillima]|nr:MAG: hypothetical protein M4579_002713 [Chaenotheca gracillima]
MADIDADLLALAGDDDSSEDETTQQLDNATKPESPRSEKSSSPSGKRKRDTSTKPAATKKRVSKPSGAARRVKARKRDDSEEEGEASSGPSSPSSLQSAPMSESESEPDNAMASRDGITQFPIEGRFESQADKDHILSLPEIKREEILAERAGVMEREQQRRMLTQLLRDKEREKKKDSDQKKRKATDDDDPQRKSSRQKTTLGGRKLGESSAPLEEYKRQREQRGLHNEQRRRDDGRRSSDPKKSADLSDPDAEGESEGEWDNSRPGSAAKRPSPSRPAKLEPPNATELNRIKIGHNGFAQLCFYPGFEQTMIDCFVRINVGPPAPGEPDNYRVAKIKKFVEGKPYAMNPPEGRAFVTNQYVSVAHGKAERVYPFIFCSEGPISDRELNRYNVTCEMEGVPTPNRDIFLAKNKAIHQLINRSWTDAELQEKLGRSGALAHRTAGADRRLLRQMRENAVAKGDEELIAKCDADLAALEPPKLAFGTTLSPKKEKSKEPDQQERLAAVNRANRKANAENVRRAQLKERRAEAIERDKIARGEAVANPFARVKTRAKIHYDHNGTNNLAVPSSQNTGSGSDISRAGTPASPAPTGANSKAGTPQRALTPLAEKNSSGDTKKGGGLFSLRRRMMDDEIIGSLDLGIEIDI